MEFVDLIRTPKLDRVVLHRPLSSSVEGTLCITSHHLIFSSRKGGDEELWLLHRMVDCVDRRIGPISGSLFLKCKDFRILQLDISGVEECNNVANSVECLSSLENKKWYYPFFHRVLFDIMEDGWTAFSVENSFAKIKLLTDDWRISTVNKDFTVCSSYPEHLVVPKSVGDDVLAGSAAFRWLGRFPVLSYFHKKGKAALLRCSQPMVGTSMRRSEEDETLLKAVIGNGKKGYIIDTRTQNFAQLSRTKGGGYEPEVHYPLWRRLHKPIERYSTLLDSLSKLIEAVSDTGVSVDKWLSRLESSGWLSHIKDVLGCACFVAQCLDQDEAPVVVHGSEGMDSTLQVCALAQVILDPDCRTVRGFEALVEQEWLQAGHPFGTRCFHGAYAPASIRTRDQSPSFLIFLDCVYQIHQQFSCSFEFNEQFLILLFEHSCASSFGTFIADNEKEKLELKLPQKTVSLWSYVNRPEVLPTLLNPMYDPNNQVIWPSVAPQSLVVWPAMYLRWVYDQSPQQEAWVTVSEIRERDKELRSKAIRLRRQLLELEREAVAQGLFHGSSAVLE